MAIKNTKYYNIDSMADSSTTENKHEPFVAIDIGAYSVKFVYIERKDDGSPLLKTLAQICLRKRPFRRKT